MLKNVLNPKKLIDKVFVWMFAAVTVFILLFGILTAGSLFRPTSYEKLKQVDYSTYKAKEGEYYVFIYNEESERNDWYENIVLEYAAYARAHGSARPIYGYNYTKSGNSNIASDLSVTSSVATSIPGLILIKDGKVNTKYLSWTKIQNELTSQLGY